jgi:hypothetical protein
MHTESLIMKSFTSVVSVVLSVYSYVYYLKQNK